MMEPAREARREGAPWFITLVLLLGLGLVLRAYDFGAHPRFIFDEHHFVENARNYLAGKADWNDHPPLGKLFIAASIRAFGDGAVGWRLPSLFFGLWTVLAGGVAAARLFGSRRAGLIAAALLSSDGFFIAYARVGLLDGLLASSLVTALLLATLRWRWPLAVGAGLLLGCAVNVKFSGVGLAVPLFISLGLAEGTWRRKAALALLLGAVSGGVYLGLYGFGLQLAGQRAGVGDVLAATTHLLNHHAGLTDMKNQFVSGWATWFFPRRAPVMGAFDAAGLTHVLSMLGNLATWWSTTLFAAAASWAVLRLGFSQLLAPPAERASGGPVSRFALSHGRAALLLLGGAVGFLAPWALSHRDSYLYHYLPSYAALVMLLAGFLGWLRPHAPRLVLGFLCVVLVVAAFYAPVWSFMPLSHEGLRSRLFLSGWR